VSGSGTALLCLMVFANTFCVGAFGPLLPEIARAQGLADWQLGLLAGSFGLARMIADVPTGLLAGRRLGMSLASMPAWISRTTAVAVGLRVNTFSERVSNSTPPNFSSRNLTYLASFMAGAWPVQIIATNPR